MSYEEVIFYVVAVPTVVGAIGVVTARNVVHSALFLILSLLAVAGIFILLAAEFLAIVQVLIYGGAVTILVLFAMMLTRVRDMPAALDGPQRPFAALAAGVFMAVSIVAVVSTEWPGESEEINVISYRADRHGSVHDMGGPVRDRVAGANGGADRRDHPGARGRGGMMRGGATSQEPQATRSRP